MSQDLADEIYRRIEPGLPTADTRLAVADALDALAGGDADA